MTVLLKGINALECMKGMLDSSLQLASVELDEICWISTSVVFLLIIFMDYDQPWWSGDCEP